MAQFLPSRSAMTEPQASVMDTNFIEHYACSGTKLIDETELSICNKCYKKALERCCGTSYLGARKLSRYRICIAGRCAHPERSEGRVQVSANPAMRGQIPPRRGKKCDDLSRDLGKQLTHIVRVISRLILPEKNYNHFSL